MATAVLQDNKNFPTSKSLEQKEAPVNIPEILDEQRKDSDGKSITYRYVRGKLLGKVIY